MTTMLRHRHCAALAVALVFATHVSAVDREVNAAPPIPTAALVPASAAAGERTWYGWQIMLSDLAVAGTVAGAVAAEHPGPLLAGEVLFVGGGPAIHFAHHRGGAAGWSLARRLVLPLGFAIAGAVIGGKNAGSGDDLGPGLAYAVFGFATGTGTAMAYDWITAWETGRVEPPWQAAAPAPDRIDAPPESPASHWAPVLAFGPGRASLGLAVTF